VRQAPRTGAGANELKLLIAGGGTGGHVFPALAVAREWLSRHHDGEAVFVGTERGLEARLVPQSGFRLETIRSAGLKGIGGARLLRNLMLVAVSFWDSAAILRRHRFSVAFGVGGYAAGPMMLAAAMLGIPSVIFEPNAEAGFTNRVLAGMAQRIAVGYPVVAERLGSRAVVTGCPVRPEFFACQPRHPAARFQILITGGSQGSRAINRAVIEAAEILSPENKRFAIVHQTGDAEYNSLREVYAQRNINAEVAPFFENMAERFAHADLIVCRSGAITVAEVAAAGRAALFIPFGAAADSHQLRNAEEMVRGGASLLIPESELSGRRLAREILSLLDHPQRLADLGLRARQMARPNATREIVDLIEEVARA